MAMKVMLCKTAALVAMTMTLVSPTVTLAQAGAAAAPAPRPAESYVLGTGDVIEVAVVGREDYKARVRVQDDGSIQLPLIGTVTATGKTTLQLGADVRQALRAGGYFSNPAVSVDVATYSSRYATVLGEVGQPGLVPIDRAYRVSEILARVGGVKETGDDKLTLKRATGEDVQLSVLALATGGASEDPMVNPGDKLYIPAAKNFFIYGQVTAPGSYRLDEKMTARKAIARGGGLTESGSEKRVRVYRNGEELRKFNLSDGILPGDVVVVGERFF